jgi:hypothetical protein
LAALNRCSGVMARFLQSKNTPRGNDSFRCHWPSDHPRAMRIAIDPGGASHQEIIDGGSSRARTARNGGRR